MTTNAERAEILERALRARVDRDRTTVDELYTDDVKAWTPALSTSTRAELLAEFDRIDDAFTDVTLEVTPLDVGGDFACAEWAVSVAAPQGSAERITVHGVTVAEFQGDRICSLRQYWDELSVAELLDADQAEPGD